MGYLQDYIKRKIRVDENGLHGDLQGLIKELIDYGWRQCSDGNPLAHVEVCIDGITLVFEYDPGAPSHIIKVRYNIGNIEVYHPLELCGPIHFEIPSYLKKASGF